MLKGFAGRVAGVQPLAAHGQDRQADAALRQVGFDGQPFGRTARQPVRLGDGQHVAVAQEGEALGQPRAALRLMPVQRISSRSPMPSTRVAALPSPQSDRWWTSSRSRC